MDVILDPKVRPNIPPRRGRDSQVGECVLRRFRDSRFLYGFYFFSIFFLNDIPFPQFRADGVIGMAKKKMGGAP